MVALSHPISRYQFIVGKFCGVLAVLIANWVLLTTSFFMIYKATAGVGAAAGTAMAQGLITQPIMVSLVLGGVQGVVLAAFALLLSTFSTVSLSVIITAGIYLVGSNISQIRLMASQSKSEFTASALRAIAAVLPNMENFSVGFRATYDLPVPGVFVVQGLVYAVILLIFSLVVAGLLLQSREV